MKKARDGFKKLLSNIKMNALSMDDNGEFTIINSSTNRKRMKNDSSGKIWGSHPNSKVWIPSKIYIDEKDLQQIWKKQNELCYWFKIPLNFNLLFSDYADYYPKHPLAPSVDKIDDKKDYTIDNIVICCMLANFGRNVYPFEPFQTVIDIVTHKTKVNNLDDFYND